MRKKKTQLERFQKLQREIRYKKRLAKENPLKSPCLPLRRRHCFGRGIGKIHKSCVWCGKSREQIKREQKT